MVNVYANGKRYKCPVCLEDLTTAQLQRIISEWDFTKPLPERDYFHLFRIFTGVEHEKFYSSSDNEVTIWNCVKWFVENPYFSNEMPNVIELRGKKITIPTNIKKLSIAQNVYVKMEAQKGKMLLDANGNVIEYSCYSKAVAIFLQPFLNGGVFDYVKALELENDILLMKAYIVRPIGFFLLRDASKHGNGSISRLTSMMTVPIRSFVNRFLKWPEQRGLNTLQM